MATQYLLNHLIDSVMLEPGLLTCSHPRSSAIVMLATVVAVVYIHNLAIGVLLGVLLSGIFFADKIAQLFGVTSTVSADGRVRTYRVEGQLFYGSVEDFMAALDFKEALDRVVIDVWAAHIWDISSVQALDMAVLKFRRDGAEVEIVSMNDASETRGAGAGDRQARRGQCGRVPASGLEPGADHPQRHGSRLCGGARVQAHQQGHHCL